MNNHTLGYCKSPLPFDEYNKFEINHFYEAYIIEFQHISLERCDELEQQLQLDGYKIFHTETVASRGSYNIIYVVGQSKLTF